ncbi:MAG: transglycosylase domain-containing protein [Candidatus Saccharimonadales bacterium]|nr:transglycosylase domain-containing protein [Candidatus Saccharimonadales bacterium]
MPDKLGTFFSQLTADIKKRLKKFSKSVNGKFSDVKKRINIDMPPAFKAKKRKKAKDNSDKLKVYSNVGSKRRSKKDQKSRRKAEYLASLPKHPVKRFIYRLHPKRFFKYWFSKRGAIMALKLAGISFAIFAAVIIGLFAWFRKDLPNPNEIAFIETTKFYDRTGEHLLFELYGEQNRTLLEYDQISDYAKWATIAIEDKDFYEHGGFSISGIMRAAWSNLRTGDTTGQGGSTITQQFIKNSLLTDEQTYTRKIKELILAIELERLYTKDEILTFYLNEIPYGTQAYGIEAAAQSFFDKPALELTIDESAMLAALPQAPSLYSPYIGDTDALTERRDYIIGLMVEQGYITQEEGDKAKETNTLKKIVPLDDRNLYRGVLAPHFIDEVKRRLEEKYTESLVATGGLKVITTLDFQLQKEANKAMKDNFKYVQSPESGGGSGGDNAALNATDVETGQVLAQVGSRNYNYKGYGAYNAAAPPPNSTVSGRQPGSSFKPYAYAKLFENPRWSPGSLIWDNDVPFPNGYNPNNFDFNFPGKMKIREALGESRNIPAVKAMYISGADNVVDTAREMGLESIADCPGCLSLVLGAGEVKLDEHTNAYATFSRGGKYKPNTYILRVENPAGDVLHEWTDTGGEQVIDEETAYLITDVLRDDAARSGTFGLGNQRLVVPGLNHTVKTGTTDRSVDGWMMGYTTCLAVGVWAGNHDSKPMDTITSWQTGPMFTQFMDRAHKKQPCENPEFERPDGIKSVRISSSTGYNTSKGGHSDIAASWFKGVDKESGTKVTIDTISGRLATDCTPDRAKKEVSNSGPAPELDESDPLFEQWAKMSGSTSSKIIKKDNVHKCSDDKPSVSLSVSELAPGVYELEADVNEGTHDMKTLNFKVDGTTVSSQSVTNSGSFSYVHVFNSTGVYDVQAEVIDEVLYEDSSNSQQINVGLTPGTPDIFSPSNGGSGNTPKTDIFWSSVSGADGYEVCYRKEGTSNWICETTTSSNEDIQTNSSGTWNVYVIAYTSGYEISRSSTITFST